MHEKHLAWAKGHDWGKQAFLNKGKLFIPNDGSNTHEPYAIVRGAWLEFSSFQELAWWAGY